MSFNNTTKLTSKAYMLGTQEPRIFELNSHHQTSSMYTETIETVGHSVSTDTRPNKRPTKAPHQKKQLSIEACMVEIEIVPPTYCEEENDEYGYQEYENEEGVEEEEFEEQDGEEID